MRYSVDRTPLNNSPMLKLRDKKFNFRHQSMAITDNIVG